MNENGVQVGKSVLARFGISSRTWCGYSVGDIFSHRTVFIPLILLGLIAACAICAPLIAPYDPGATDLKNVVSLPSSEHLLGTDYLGRDVLSRLVYGARTSLFIALTTIAVSCIAGIVIGCVAGYRGGVVDLVLSRGIDVFIAFPGIIFALVLLGFLGPGIFNLILALSLTQWAGYARLIRGEVLSTKNEDYVLSARTVGLSDRIIMFRHILPNVVAPVLILATIDVGHVILSTATLSFFGLGVPADVPEWGSMINAGKNFMRTAPLLTIIPGLTITAVVVLFNVLGEGLRDVLDPHDGAEAFD